MKITIEHKGRDTAWTAEAYALKRFGEIGAVYTEDRYDNKRSAITDMPMLLDLIREQITDGLNAEWED